MQYAAGYTYGLCIAPTQFGHCRAHAEVFFQSSTHWPPNLKAKDTRFFASD